MATFGTPVSRGNDAQNALQCARQMQIEMREWEKERENGGKPKSSTVSEFTLAPVLSAMLVVMRELNLL